MSAVSFLAAGAAGPGGANANTSAKQAAQETATDSAIRAPSASAGSPEANRNQEANEHSNDKEPHDNKQDDEKASSEKKQTRIAVTVSRKNPIDSLSRRELERVFLRQKTTWPNGWPITVYERHSDNPIREEFSMTVLGKRPSKLREYWLNLKLTRGMKAPKACRSAELVKRYTERVKGGIGYMYEREVDDTVKVLMVIPVEERDKRD